MRSAGLVFVDSFFTSRRRLSLFVLRQHGKTKSKREAGRVGFVEGILLSSLSRKPMGSHVLNKKKITSLWRNQHVCVVVYEYGVFFASPRAKHLSLQASRVPTILRTGQPAELTTLFLPPVGRAEGLSGSPVERVSRAKKKNVASSQSLSKRQPFVRMNISRNLPPSLSPSRSLDSSFLQPKILALATPP